MTYYVYLLASRRHGTLYLGITNNLVRRVHEHRSRTIPGFTARYAVDRLVWFETYNDPANAITREKAIKKWDGIGRSDWLRSRTRTGGISTQLFSYDVSRETLDIGAAHPYMTAS